MDYFSDKQVTQQQPAQALMLRQFFGRPPGDIMQRIDVLRELCWPNIYAKGGTLHDEDDNSGRHWVVEDESKLVAAARLTIHADVDSIPDPHPYRDFNAEVFHFPLAYLSRLVVHPDYRGRGIARSLDAARVAEALKLDCRMIVGSWNPSSGEGRRSQLLSIGFRSLDDDLLHDDGVFDKSAVYFKDFCDKGI